MSAKKLRNKRAVEMEMMLFSNAPNAAQYNVLELFYRGVLGNTLGLMEAKDKATGELTMLLVGLDKDGDEVKTYPLAALLKPQEGDKYLAPDGKGGYS